MRYSIVLKTDHDFLWLYKSRVSLFYYHILSIISISKQKKDDDWKRQPTEKEGEGYLVLSKEDLRPSQCTIPP